jgi:hypothetical protein
VQITRRERRLEAEFSVRAGERACFVLTWYLSWEDAPPPIDAVDAVAETDAWWRAWSGRSTYKGAWKDEVERSLITLKALTHAPTGGLVAAASPSSSAACETGTTGSVGSGTRRSRSTR